MIRWIALSLALLGVCAGCRQHARAPAYDGSLSLALSTNSVTVGDPLTATLRVPHGLEETVLAPDLNNPPAWVVRGMEINERTNHTEITYALVSLATGDHSLTSGPVAVVSAAGTNLYALPFASFRVDSVLSPTNNTPLDIKENARWPAPSYMRLLWILLAIVALAAIVGLFARHMSRRVKQVPAAAPLPPPHVLALQALEALIAKGYIEQGRIEPFYIELSGIVRFYLEARFNLRAPERTTEEFIREATTSNRLKLEHQQLTSAFLEQCDLVKFARHEPGAADMHAALNAAQRLVTETMPSPPPSATGGSAP